MTVKRTTRRTPPLPPPSPSPAYPKVIETYREPWLRDVVQDEPSAFNGDVRIQRYRVTVELIEEPIDVLRDRLRKLWREDERNHHQWGPMRAAAGRTRPARGPWPIAGSAARHER